MTKMSRQQLLDLKKQIEAYKNKVAELNGRRQERMKELSKTWNCSSLEQANEEYDKMVKDIEAKQKKLFANIDELKQKYDL